MVNLSSNMLGWTMPSNGVCSDIKVEMDRLYKKDGESSFTFCIQGKEKPKERTLGMC